MPNEAHIIALAGNPNVGKSTVFNTLTGLRQHTGNWPGKTVAAARGDLTYGGERFTLVDLPGTYSLFPNSAEEEIARDYLCSGEAEAVLILADATCLERSLNLVLQTLEAADVPAVVCVNLLDEAAKKGIVLDLPALSHALGAPVVGTAASCGEGLDKLRAALAAAVREKPRQRETAVEYPRAVERAVRVLEPALAPFAREVSRRSSRRSRRCAAVSSRRSHSRTSAVAWAESAPTSASRRASPVSSPSSARARTQTSPIRSAARAGRSAPKRAKNRASSSSSRSA